MPFVYIIIQLHVLYFHKKYKIYYFYVKLNLSTYEMHFQKTSPKGNNIYCFYLSNFRCIPRLQYLHGFQVCLVAIFHCQQLTCQISLEIVAVLSHPFDHTKHNSTRKRKSFESLNKFFSFSPSYCISPVYRLLDNSPDTDTALTSSTPLTQGKLRFRQPIFDHTSIASKTNFGFNTTFAQINLQCRSCIFYEIQQGEFANDHAMC